MKRTPLSWTKLLKTLFGPVRRKATARKRIPTRLQAEELDARIVPATYHPNAAVADTNVTGSNSLRADITAANVDGTANATETFDLASNATYTLTIPNPLTGHEQKNASGDLNIVNSNGGGTKTYIFNGNGATIDQTQLDRVIQIIGSNVKVEFNNLIITGGTAYDNGGVGALRGYTSSEGGGVLNDGGTVTFQNCSVSGNDAIGYYGSNGFNETYNATKAGSFGTGIELEGGSGSSGANAYGGGIYSTGGTVTLISTIVTGNIAIGGNGGNGGYGGNVSKNATGSAGLGGDGGDGGSAAGGGVYLAAGTLVMEDATEINGNQATGGLGGNGGAGGKVAEKSILITAAAGGFGGNGGSVVGGGVYVAVGGISMSGDDTVTTNLARAGNGGNGGAGGDGASPLNNGGLGGYGGAAGAATGGGLYALVGSVSLTGGSALNDNHAHGGDGGAAGNGGTGNALKTTSGGYSGGIAGSGGVGGAGGTSIGGGIYAGNGLVTLDEASVVANDASAGSGGAGGAGGGGKPLLDGAGGAGGAGGSAEGGGLYAGLGGVTLDDATVESNAAGANVGGGGGAGASAALSTASAQAGAGGAGGAAGNVEGGGIYVIDGEVQLTSNSFVEKNEAIAQGPGGAGGHGGNRDAKLVFGGAGGPGGAGTIAMGGGVYDADGTVNVATGAVFSNAAIGGSGGAGGHGGTVTVQDDTPGSGGVGGAGGAGLGGGVYVASGQINVKSTGPVSGNLAQGGVGGNGGPGGFYTGYRFEAPGGNGGAGGNGEGGGIWASTAAVDVSGSVLSNAVRAGNGGNGGATISDNSGYRPNGAGGDGGSGQGGGIYSISGNITVQAHAKMEDNVVTGGAGGSGANEIGGTGGAGGNAGDGQGGGIFTLKGNVSINSALIASNVANGNVGGAGGVGSPFSGGTTGTTTSGGTTGILFSGGGGHGGEGGAAEGGGIYLGGGNLTLVLANISDNRVGGNDAGGAGGGSVGYSSSTPYAGAYAGVGGDGGLAAGGGIFMAAGSQTLSVQQSSVTDNTAGPGGAGGTGGDFNGLTGMGGNSEGGGIFTAANSLILNSTIAYNTADVAGGQGSFEGVSQGGGVFVTEPGPTVTVGTVIANSTIAFNTSNDQGGGIENSGGDYPLIAAGQLTLTSTLVADNTSNTTTAADFDDSGTSVVTYSLIETTAGNTVATSNTSVGDIVGVTSAAVNLDPTLQTASNGTRYLYFSGTSDAFNVGTNSTGNPYNPYSLTTDQVGDPITTKPAQELDIGSVQTANFTTGVTFIVTAGKNGYVEIINPTTHAVYQDFQPFSGYKGLVSVAEGDVNDDGIPDIIVAAKGKVKVYSGAAVTVPGVSFAASSTWYRLSSAIGKSTPVLDPAESPFPGYTGALNVASGDVNGDGYADIIVATAAGTVGKVVVYNGKTDAPFGASFEPFGAKFKGGIVVAAGDVTGNGPANVIVGTQTEGDSVEIYQLEGSAFDQVASPISLFGTLPSTAQLELAAINLAGTGIDDIAIGLLENGVGTVDIVDESGSFVTNSSGQTVTPVNLGGGLTSMAISAVNTGTVGPDSLLVGTVPGGSAQFFILQPVTGTKSSSFAELTALTGGISVAGI